jgi:pimeloyl-ACP methyl ester carboxylesterase
VSSNQQTRTPEKPIRRNAVETSCPAPVPSSREPSAIVPVLVGAGADDVGDVRALADLLATELPRATRLPDVANAARLLPLEQPEPVNAALLAFLEHLPLGAPPDRR